MFVAMPYGTRMGSLDFMNPDSEVEIDFEHVWRSIISPAIPSSFEFMRAEDIQKPGPLDRIYLDWLFNAHVVVADLTFGNANVYYELGIRHSLSKRGTVLVAQEGSVFPFDVRNQKVIFYDFFGKNTIFKKKLRTSVLEAASHELDSPVHQILTGLFIKHYKPGDSPLLQIKQLKKKIAEQDQKIDELQITQAESRLLRKIEQNQKKSSALISIFHQIANLSVNSIEVFELLGKNLTKVGKFDESITVLKRARAIAPKDSDILRELGFAYRKKSKRHYNQAKKYFSEALSINDGDPELHGMLGGMLKRQGKYKEARKHYQRAYQLDKENLYGVVTMGAISAVLHNKSDAVNYYEEVLDLSLREISARVADHWTYFCRGEASVYFGNKELALQSFEKSLEFKPPTEDVRSAAESLEFLIEHGLQRTLAQNILDRILYPIIHGYNIDEDNQEGSTVQKASQTSTQETQNTKRKKLFISYAHNDSIWLKRVQTHMKALENEGAIIELWDDTRIKPGMNWSKEIQLALTEAKVALLLISADFLASDFITKNELPPLLIAAEEGGAKIIPLIIKPSRFKHHKLSRFQAINNPSKPLVKLPEAEQEEILVEMTEVIEEYID